MQDNRERVLNWIQAGLIEEQNIAPALQVSQAQPSGEQWQLFIKKALLWLSVACLCSGVIFFFAYNWQALSRMMRFAIAESAMLILSVSYLRCAANAKLKVALLMAMVLLTGSLLALFGQTYQTGADPWQLFALWCVLITPWTCLARSSILWVFWLLLLNLGYFLFVDLNLRFSWLFHAYEGSLLLDLVAINTLLLVMFELAAKYKLKQWFSADTALVPANRYSQQVVLCLLLAYLSIWSIEGIFDRRDSSYWFFAYVGLATACYRYLLKDLFALAVLSLGFLVVSSCLLIKMIDSFETDITAYIFFCGVYVLGTSSFIGMYLKRTSLIFQQQLVTILEDSAERERY